MSGCPRHPGNNGPYWCQDCRGVHEIGRALEAGGAVVDEPPDELEEQFEIAVARAVVDPVDRLEQAIAQTEAALVDRRRLEKIAAGYPEFVGRRGALLIAIAALAWERGRPLHLRTQPADVARLGRLETLALRGVSVVDALEEGQAEASPSRRTEER